MDVGEISHFHIKKLSMCRIEAIMGNLSRIGDGGSGMAKTEGKNIFVILSYNQCFCIFAYLVVHTGTGTVHKRTEPVFFMGCPPDRHPQPDNAQLSV